MKPLLLIASMALSLIPIDTFAEEEKWYKDVIQVMVDGKPLNTADGRPSRDGKWFKAEQLGHAAPIYYDWDKDGRKDLLVGGFSGRFRVYLNEGQDDAPVFNGYNWVRAGEDIVVLRNFCCIATGIRMADIDGDGKDDLTAGHYAPGYTYWFQGRKDGFAPRQVLTEFSGLPVLTGLDTVAEDSGINNSLSAKPAWMDWNDDGDLDLILGNFTGDLVVRYRSRHGGADGLTPIPGQPVYNEFEAQFSVYDYVEGGAGILAEENFLSPTIADWDADGLKDIVVGAGSGAVYWLKNTGKAGAPSFAAPKMLLPGLPGKAYPPYQLLKEDQAAARGARASVDVADWDGDGKLDLIVGDWAQSFRLRSDLTEEEQQEFADVKTWLVRLDKRAGIEGPEIPLRDRMKGTTVYIKNWNSKLSQEMRTTETMLFQYFDVVRPEYDGKRFGHAQYHGQVWVYLRK